ncbi:Pilus assembly protein, PilO [Anaerohalosphaera lusitana]|uniref:Pilus assembly protein, PilO n=1 Tax=Anaerohalosphaera lusitana TaxID=1936003 RepID=A0A1U9NNU0_9BACT|nr:type 4a pilus biogenesis protein PilO [Anaerohalosphaera lusitana]AQT69573.1 Pilus assembly protein, PilO [Anaerohalosphaera lusitana]
MSTGFRKLIFFIVLIGLAYVAWAYMIKPANEDLKKQKAAVETKRAKLTQLENATRDAEDLSKQLTELDDAMSFFENKLPPKSEIHKVLENITMIAQKQGLKPKTIRTLKQKNTHGYVEQPLSMELSGNFSSYYQFLLEIENLDRISQIKELSLKKKSKFEGETEATFIVSIFFQDTKA